jgi:aspartate racemase
MLPTDRPRPALQTYNGERHSLWLPRAQLDALSAVSRAHSGTLFMTLLAAVDVLLHRYTRQDDILLGTPIASRNRAEVEDLIGYFTNTLVLRTDLSGDPSFGELVGRTRQVAIEAFANQDAPLERLIQELQLERNPSHTPLFQTLLVLQNIRGNRAVSSLPPDTLSLPGLDVSLALAAFPRTAKFDLSFGIGEHVDGLHVSFEYNTDLFDEQTIVRMSAHFATLLEGIVADPARPISKLPLLTPDERRKLSGMGSSSQSGIKRAPTLLHGVFEEQAAHAPDAEAAVAGNRVFTYRELDRQANRLAHRLSEAGVVPGDRIGVCLEPSVMFARTVLAVLKAGAACVPLDPVYPAERLAFMIEDAAISLVVAGPSTNSIVTDHAVDVLQVDEAEASDDRYPETQPDGKIDGRGIAYVIYTSGSTGRPRGVELTHEGLANHAGAAARSYGIRPDDRTLQFSSVSFDISIEEMFATWAGGAAVVFRETATPLAGAEFLDWLSDHSITVLDLPTAYWHLWVHDLATGGRCVPATIRTVIVGGERALPSAYQEWLGVAGEHVRWFNTYGPTEASVVVTVWEAPSSTPGEAPDVLPIGRPLENVRVYVLDDAMQPTPIGVPGELYVGGAGVARGYLDRPELTAEKFLPNPFGHDPGDRLYRTGDLVRFRPDAELEFVGRTDDQIKIRGYRVEPGEVEVALREHPAIREALVVARADEGGDKRLVAYVTADSPVPSVSEVRDLVRHGLPEYMVPSAIGFLDAFPLTPNGKVDHAQLARMPLSELERVHALAPARTDTERCLQRIWKSALAVEHVGIHDDFFELGGHSLIAVRMVAEIERQLGVRVPLTALFHEPTIAGLADAVDREREVDRPWESLVALRDGGSKPPLFLFGWIGGDVIGYRDLVQSFPPDRPLYGLRTPGLDGRSLPPATIEEIAAHYREEILRFQPDSPYLFAGFCFGGVVAYEVARQLAAEGREVEFVGLISASPFGHLPARPHHGVGVKLRPVVEARGIGAKARHVGTRLSAPGGPLRRQPRRLHYRLGKRAYRLASVTGWRWPNRFWQFRLIAGGLARARYVTPVTDLRVTFFPPDSSGVDHRIALWNRLAHGGVDVRTIEVEGLTHVEMMRAPYAEALGAVLSDAIADALAERSAPEVVTAA